MILTPFETLAKYYPYIVEKVVRHKELSSLDVIVELADGTVHLFDGFERALRRLPKSTDMTEVEFRKEFGERLYAILFRKGVTQTELSKRTGIQVSLINNYIHGKVTPSSYNLDKIAKALNCSADAFRYTKW